MADSNLRHADGPRAAFCQGYLPALRRLDLGKASLSATRSNLVELAFTPAYSIGLRPDASGRPRVSLMAIPIG